MTSSKKKVFTDPSFAVASMNLTHSDLEKDLNTFGFIFENLCVRDLKVYSSKYNGTLNYYRDRSGLEADIVLTLDNNKYALIECKLGSSGIEEGAKHLLKLKNLIINNHGQEPAFEMILTGGEMAFTRKDGIHIVPIGCLGV